MTSASFNRPGAIDLSGLGSPAAAAGAAGGASYVIDVDEAGLDAVVQQSAKHLVIMELHSPRAHGAAELSENLRQLSSEAAGKWLLARVNVDAEQRVAQAFGVQAVPTVLAVIGGQLAPLFQGTLSKQEISQYIAQAQQLAVSNGIVGGVQPTGSAPPAQQAAQGDSADPRFAAADDALAKGDFKAAVAEFDKILTATPNDSEAVAGRAQASLLVRSMSFNPAKIVERAKDADDVDAQLDAADLEIINGDASGGFDRLISVLRDTSGDDRERVRVRLLELFETVGASDPAVLKARRNLSTALF